MKEKIKKVCLIFTKILLAFATTFGIFKLISHKKEKND